MVQRLTHVPKNHRGIRLSPHPSRSQSPPRRFRFFHSKPAPFYPQTRACGRVERDLRHLHPLIEWWYELSANACRLIIRDLVNLPENQDRVRDGNYSFLKTNATFDRAMEIGRKRNKWTHRRLT
jgi:hypothetical protein